VTINRKKKCKQTCPGKGTPICRRRKSIRVRRQQRKLRDAKELDYCPPIMKTKEMSRKIRTETNLDKQTERKVGVPTKWRSSSGAPFFQTAQQRKTFELVKKIVSEPVKKQSHMKQRKKRSSLGQRLKFSSSRSKGVSMFSLSKWQKNSREIKKRRNSTGETISNETAKQKESTLMQRRSNQAVD
jgi:hypothetical protein